MLYILDNRYATAALKATAAREEISLTVTAAELEAVITTEAAGGEATGRAVEAEHV